MDENLVSGWLNMLQALHLERSDYPFFMRNDAWRDKQLTTSLASWTEMRRDAILMRIRPMRKVTWGLIRTTCAGMSSLCWNFGHDSCRKCNRTAES
ncbi:MAG: DUF3160 domain-containing protein [bacterium]|nr:DUF3160 domain-containing protein [bacterium]